jgi:hypothetical protein
MPMARPRSSPSKMLSMIDKVVGKIAAPPTPMSARNAISVVALVANAASPDPTPKITSPTSSASRRPYLSPRFPATSRSAANVKV